MILAFIMGAVIFFLGVVVGVSITQSVYAKNVKDI